MIAENMIYFAIAVFILLVIGLVLTILEFRYGAPHKQQVVAEQKRKQVGEIHDQAA